MSARSALFATPAALALLLAGCTSGAGPAPTTVLLPTVAPPPTTAAASTTAPAPVLPANCASMIAGNQLDTVLGVAVSATVDVVVGEPLPDIGRTGRITCRYGAAVDGVFPLEISLTSYDTAEQAADRVTTTVTAAELEGVGSTVVAAGGTDGTLIPYPSGALLVASSGVYSVAVTVVPALVPADRAGATAGAVAGVVLAAAGV